MSLIWFRHHKHRFLCQALAVAIALQFIGSHAVWALDGPGSHLTMPLASASTSTNPLTPEKILSLSIPETIGSIKKTSLGSQNKIIIQIQDSHVNYEAQSNIIKILEHLDREISGGREGGPSPFLIAIEGAAGESELEWFRTLPEKKVKEEALDYFLARGSLSAAQFFQAMSPRPVKVMGVEDPHLYSKNFDLFREVHRQNQAVADALSEWERALGLIRQQRTNESLRRFSENSQAFHDGKLSFSEYMDCLQMQTRQSSFEEMPLAQLRLYREAMRLDREINYALLQSHQEQFVAQLMEKLSHEDQALYLQMALQFKAGRLSALDFYRRLWQLAEPILTELPALDSLQKYTRLLELQSQLDPEKLFEEIEQLEERLTETLAQTAEEREGEHMLKSVRLLRQLSKLELSRPQLKAYRRHPELFSPTKIGSFIQTQCQQLGIPFKTPENLEFREELFRVMEEFYATALARDEMLVQNTLKELERAKLDVAIVITGGFHTEGMWRQWVDQNDSVVVISPKLTQQSDNRAYLQAMLDFDFAVTQKLNRKGNRLSPPIRVGVHPLGPVELPTQGIWRAMMATPDGKKIPVVEVIREDPLLAALYEGIRQLEESRYFKRNLHRGQDFGWSPVLTRDPNWKMFRVFYNRVTAFFAICSVETYERLNRSEKQAFDVALQGGRTKGHYFAIFREIPLPIQKLLGLEESTLEFLNTSAEREARTAGVGRAGSASAELEVERLPAVEIATPEQIQDLSELQRRPLQYGWYAPMYKKHKAGLLYAALLTIFTDKGFAMELAVPLALSLSRMKPGSLEVLAKLGVLTYQVRLLLALKNHVVFKQMDPAPRQDFADRIRAVLEDIETAHSKGKINKKERDFLAMSLFPMPFISYLEEQLGISRSLVIQILQTHPDFPAWLPVAKNKVDPWIRDGMDRTSAWKRALAKGKSGNRSRASRRFDLWSWILPIWLILGGGLVGCGGAPRVEEPRGEPPAATAAETPPVVVPVPPTQDQAVAEEQARVRAELARLVAAGNELIRQIKTEGVLQGASFRDEYLRILRRIVQEQRFRLIAGDLPFLMQPTSEYVIEAHFDVVQALSDAGLRENIFHEVFHLLKRHLDRARLRERLYEQLPDDDSVFLQPGETGDRARRHLIRYMAFAVRNEVEAYVVQLMYMAAQARREGLSLRVYLLRSAELHGDYRISDIYHALAQIVTTDGEVNGGDLHLLIFHGLTGALFSRQRVNLNLLHRVADLLRPDLDFDLTQDPSVDLDEFRKIFAAFVPYFLNPEFFQVHPGELPDEVSPPAAPSSNQSESLVANMFSGKLSWLNWLIRLPLAGAVVPHEFGHWLAGKLAGRVPTEPLGWRHFFSAMPWQTRGPSALAGLFVNLLTTALASFGFLAFHSFILHAISIYFLAPNLFLLILEPIFSLILKKGDLFQALQKDPFVVIGKNIAQTTADLFINHFTGNPDYKILSRITIERKGERDVEITFHVLGRGFPIILKNVTKENPPDLKKVDEIFAGLKEEILQARRSSIKKLGLTAVLCLAATVVGSKLLYVLYDVLSSARRRHSAPRIIEISGGHEQGSHFDQMRHYFDDVFSQARHQNQKVVVVVEEGSLFFDTAKAKFPELQDIRYEDIFSDHPDPEKFNRYQAVIINHIQQRRAGFRIENIHNVRRAYMHDRFNQELFEYLSRDGIRDQIEEIYSEATLVDPEITFAAGIAYEDYLRLNEMAFNLIRNGGSLEEALQYAKRATLRRAESMVSRNRAFVQAIQQLREPHPNADIVYYRGLMHSYSGILRRGFGNDLSEYHATAVNDALSEITRKIEAIHLGQVSLDSPEMELLLLQSMLMTLLGHDVQTLLPERKSSLLDGFSSLLRETTREEIENVLRNLPSIYSQARDSDIPRYKAVFNFLLERNPNFERYRGLFSYLPAEPAQPKSCLAPEDPSSRREFFSSATRSFARWLSAVVVLLADPAYYEVQPQDLQNVPQNPVPGRVRSPAAGWPFVPMNYVEEYLHWFVAHVIFDFPAGKPVITSEKSEVEVPFVAGRPRDWRTAVVAGVAPVFWLAGTLAAAGVLMSTIGIIGNWFYIGYSIAFIVGTPSLIMFAAHLLFAFEPNYDLYRVLFYLQERLHLPFGLEPPDDDEVRAPSKKKDPRARRTQEMKALLTPIFLKPSNELLNYFKQCGLKLTTPSEGNLREENPAVFYLEVLEMEIYEDLRELILHLDFSLVRIEDSDKRRRILQLQEELMAEKKREEVDQALAQEMEEKNAPTPSEPFQGNSPSQSAPMAAYLHEIEETRRRASLVEQAI